MVSFADRFKSLKNQALQTIETIKEDEQVKGALGKAREKYDAVAKKIDEVTEPEAVKGFIERGEAAVGEVYRNVEGSVETSKQRYQEAVEQQKRAAVRAKLDAAAKLAKQKKYEEAIALLETAYSPESELYGEAQATVASYRHLALLEKAEKLFQQENYTESITLLEEAYQPEAEFYSETQLKITSYRQAQFSALSQQAKEAAQDERYVEAAELLEKAYQPGAEFYDEAQKKVATYRHLALLGKAEQLFRQENHTEAITLLEEAYQPESEFYSETQLKITSYRQAQFSALSQLAEEAAQDERYVEAVELLENAYQAGAEFYSEAQAKIAVHRRAALEIILRRVAVCVYNYEYTEAISLLSNVIKPDADNADLAVLFPADSDVYSEAQEHLTLCQQLCTERQQLIESHKHFSASESNGRLVPSITLDHITYEVHGAGRFTNSPGELEIFNTQGAFILIGLNLLNIDKKTREISVASMILVDAQGREYSVLANAEKLVPFLEENLFGTDKFQAQPDVATFGGLVFEVPKNATDLKLKMADGFMGRGIFLPLNLVSIEDEAPPSSDGEKQGSQR